MYELIKDGAVKHHFIHLKILTVFSLYILETVTYVQHLTDTLMNKSNHNYKS